MAHNKMPAALGAVLCTGAFGAFALAQIALPDAVETAQMPSDAFSIGSLEPSEGALPMSLWSGSDPQTLDYLLSHAPVRPVSPSIGQAMRRTLLSSGAKPAGAGEALGGKKLLALARAGFVGEARDVASLASAGRNDVYRAEADATIGLLSGDVDASCARSAGQTGQPSGREGLFWVKLRAFCYGRAGELDAYDLTMNLLRERGVLSPADEALLLAVATGAAPKMVPPPRDALQYAAVKTAGLVLDPSLIGEAQGGVIAAIMNDKEADHALRILAAEQAISMGLSDARILEGLFNAVQFEITDVAAAVEHASGRPGDPLADALLYQSIAAMSAPEFIRDKAQRISLALGRADSFARAYSLSLLYADEIGALEGVLVAPEEASSFALARMAIGDSVGAGRWLGEMVGANESVAALPEALGGQFIDRVNLLAHLDPQTAARIARGADVSLLNDEPGHGALLPSHDDAAVTARILEAAFDAVAGEKPGQAGLAALAASAGDGGGDGQVETVVVNQGLSAAGMPELRRRHQFERAWALSFSGAGAPPTGAPSGASLSPAGGALGVTPASAVLGEDGMTPRLKPRAQ